MAENNAKSPAPSGKVKPQAGDAIKQHKKMAMGIMPEVGGGPKTPA